VSEESDVIVIGAGLAGLAAALDLAAVGLKVTVLESNDEVGGRMRTDNVDGLQLDHGFQLLNPGYPNIRRLGPLDDLQLSPLIPGALLSGLTGLQRVADPLRHPDWAFASALAPVGSALAKVRLARYAAGCLRHGRDRPDTDLASDFYRSGVRGRIYNEVLRPFLTGVFLADPAEVSGNYGRYIVRSLLRGTPSLPARGMGAFPKWLAGRLPEGSVRCGIRIQSVQAGCVTTSAGNVHARHIIVATDPRSAQALLPKLPDVRLVGCTTWYFLAPETPTTFAALALDGLNRGPLLNSVALSEVVPSYATGDRHLVSATALGVGEATDAEVLLHLSQIWHTETNSWQLVKRYEIPFALPLHQPGKPIRTTPVAGEGIWIAGDYRATPSQQGALASGYRAANWIRRAESIPKISPER